MDLSNILLEYFTPYQRAWIRDESPMKLLEKSRRIGMTYATSYRRVMRALSIPGLDCWVSTRDLSTAKEFVRYCAKWCRLANVVAKGLDGTHEEVVAAGDIKAQVIEFKNGSRIYVLTSNPDALAGKGGDVVLDEFALHKDQNLLWQVALPTASVWGYQVEVISTHRGKNTLFNKFVADANGQNKMHWSLHSITIQTAVAEGLVDKINAATAKRGGKPISGEDFIRQQQDRCTNDAQWMQEYMCQPQDDFGALLTYEMLTACSSPLAQLQANPASRNVYLGMDIGRKHDLSVIWAIEDLGPMSTTREVKVMEKTPFHIQLDAFCDMFQRYNARRGRIDSTGIGAMLAEEAQRRLGTSRVEAVGFTPAEKEAMAMTMLRTFQDKAIRIPDDYEVIEDLHKVEKQVTASGHIRYVATSDEGGHADRFWALGLALSAKGDGAGLVDGMRCAPQGAEADPSTDWRKGKLPPQEFPEDLHKDRGEWAGIGER